MATAENQNLYDVYRAANVHPFELTHPSAFKRRDDHPTPLYSKVTCTLLELAQFAERVKDESGPRGTFVSVPDLYEAATREHVDRRAEIIFTMGDVVDLIEHVRADQSGPRDVAYVTGEFRKD